MFQFLQIYSIYVMSTFVEVLKNISKSIIFYPLATFTHLYTLLYKHTYNSIYLTFSELIASIREEQHKIISLY